MAVAPPETDDFPAGGGLSSRGDGSTSDDRGEAETTADDVSVGQGCPGGGRHGKATGSVTGAPASGEVDDRGSSVDGAVPAPSAVLPAPAAAVALASSLSDLSCEEPTVTSDNQPRVSGDRHGKESGEDKITEDDSDSKVFADRRRLPEPGPLTVESLSGVELVCGDIFREAW